MRSRNKRLSFQEREILGNRGMLSPSKSSRRPRTSSSRPGKTGVVIEQDEMKNTIHRDYNGEIEQSEIEKSLESKGFIPQEKIVVKDEDGEGDVTARYIRVINSDGETAIIDIDENSEMDMIEGDSLMTSTDKATSIPYSTIIGSYQCLKSTGCSVAYECDGEMCVLSNDEGINPKQTFLMKVQEDDVISAATGIGSTMGSPVLKYSYVISNPEEAKEMIAEANQIIKDNSYKACMADLTELRNMSSELAYNSNLFSSCVQLAFDKLSSGIRELKIQKRRRENLFQLDESSSDELRTIVYNISKRNQQLDELTQSCLLLKEMNVSIADETNKVKSLIDYLNQNYSKLDYIY